MLFFPWNAANTFQYCRQDTPNPLAIANDLTIALATHPPLAVDPNVEPNELAIAYDSTNRIDDPSSDGCTLLASVKHFIWADERLSNSTLTTPKFGKCCLQRTIKLPPTTDNNGSKYADFLRE
ncbi:hypothetical protein Dimus_010137, partial [Dionaea muscipula]